MFPQFPTIWALIWVFAEHYPPAVKKCSEINDIHIFHSRAVSFEWAAPLQTPTVSEIQNLNSEKWRPEICPSLSACLLCLSVCQSVSPWFQLQNSCLPMASSRFEEMPRYAEFWLGQCDKMHCNVWQLCTRDRVDGGEAESERRPRWERWGRGSSRQLNTKKRARCENRKWWRGREENGKVENRNAQRPGWEKDRMFRAACLILKLRVSASRQLRFDTEGQDGEEKWGLSVTLRQRRIDITNSTICS